MIRWRHLSRSWTNTARVLSRSSSWWVWCSNSRKINKSCTTTWHTVCSAYTTSKISRTTLLRWCKSRNWWKCTINRAPASPKRSTWWRLPARKGPATKHGRHNSSRTASLHNCNPNWPLKLHQNSWSKLWQRLLGTLWKIFASRFCKRWWCSMSLSRSRCTGEPVLTTTNYVLKISTRKLGMVRASLKSMPLDMAFKAIMACSQAIPNANPRHTWWGKKMMISRPRRNTATGATNCWRGLILVFLAALSKTQ